MPTRHLDAAGRHYLRCRARRALLFDTANLADPAWDILIDLYLIERVGGERSIIDACEASRLPQATALRWVKKLCDAELVLRDPDPLDGRRSFLRLTRGGKTKVRVWLTMLSTGC